MPARALRAAIDATVGEIVDHFVIVHYESSNGRVRIRLPIDIVPIELLRYGEPISITLTYDSGSRCPKISSRPRKTLASEDADAELDAWLRSQP